MDRWPRSTMIAVAVLAVTIAGNLVAFRAAEEELADPHRALVRVSNGLLELTLAHGRNVGSRYTLDVWLQRNAPGSVVVLRSGHPLVLESLVGLARARPELRSYEAELDATAAAALLDEATIVDWYWRGPRDALGSLETTGTPPVFTRGDFAVVVAGDGAPGAPRRLVTYWWEETVLLVEETVAREHDLDVPA